MQQGDIVEVEHLADLAGNMTELQEAQEYIHMRSSVVVDKEGRHSNTADVAGMVFEASKELKKGPPASVSRKNARQGGRPKSDRQMSAEDALGIWKDTVKHETNEQALIRMPGWNLYSAYRHLGTWRCAMLTKHTTGVHAEHSFAMTRSETPNLSRT